MEYVITLIVFTLIVTIILYSRTRVSSTNLKYYLLNKECRKLISLHRNTASKRDLLLRAEKGLDVLEFGICGINKPYTKYTKFNVQYQRCIQNWYEFILDTVNS